ncbi:MAG: hypothetical protein RLZZ341_2446 [Pseudomonadota bacterium]|jgi:hypothetical protein
MNERNIRQNAGGTFYVVINRYAGRNARGRAVSKAYTSQGSFSTLEEARAWRDAFEQSHPPRRPGLRPGYKLGPRQKGVVKP